MEDINTNQFITSRTKAGRIRLTAWRVEVVSNVELPAYVKYDRWYKVLAPFITKVERWSVQSDSHLEDRPEPTPQEWAEKAKVVFPTRNYVIRTKFGTGVIVEFSSGSDLRGITVYGSKPKAFTMGTWRKYGTKRGHGMDYLRAAHELRQCGSPEKGRDICEFEAVSWLTFGDANHDAETRALYAAVEGRVA